MYKCKKITSRTIVFLPSRDGSIAAVGTYDGWIIFYRLSDQSEVRCARAGKSRMHTMLASHSGKYFVSANDEIKVWDTKTGENGALTLSQ